MKTKTKNVYYCDHCKKHGLLRNMMERHEQRCTLNPERICHWGDKPHTIRYGRRPADGLRLLAIDFHRRASLPTNEEEINWLHDTVNGCPACMLAVLRQSGVDWHGVWKYDDEVERFRDNERQRWQDETREDDMRQLYA